MGDDAADQHHPGEGEPTVIAPPAAEYSVLDPRRPTVFDDARDFDFDNLERPWSVHYRNLVLYVRETGGLPSTRTRSNGDLIGSWLLSQQKSPGSLSLDQRVCLLAVPGVVLGTHRAAATLADQVLFVGARRTLWNRAVRWAVESHNAEARKGRTS